MRDDNRRRKTDYFYLAFGLLLILSIFVPPEILFAMPYKQLLELFRTDYLCLFPFVLLIPLAFAYLITKSRFIKETIDDILDNQLVNVMLSVICGALLFFIINALFRPVLFIYEAGLAAIALFSGTFLVISAIRDLNRLDRTDF